MIVAARTPHMDYDEAWTFTMQRAIGYWRGHIEICLKECNGSIKDAVAMSRSMYKDRIWMNSWGVYGHRGLGIDSGMADRDQGIQVWLYDRRPWGDEPPDFTISWEDVFRYVRDGAQQLALL